MSICGWCAIHNGFHDIHGEWRFILLCTHVQIDSQNPYVATFVGEPYVYTFDAENMTEVELTIQRILEQPVSYYVHSYSNTVETRNPRATFAPFRSSSQTASWHKTLKTH